MAEEMTAAPAAQTQEVAPAAAPVPAVAVAPAPAPVPAPAPEPAPPAAPEVVIPDAYTIQGGENADQGFVDLLTPVLKESKVTNEQFQKFVSVQATHADNVREAMKTETFADPLFSADVRTTNVGIAKSAMDAYGSAEVTSLLEESGLINNVHFAKMFHKIGLTLGEDNVITPAGKANKTPDELEQEKLDALYRNP